MISPSDSEELNQACRFKQREIKLVKSFLQPETAFSAPALILEGPPTSGKTFTLNKYLTILNDKYNVIYAKIDCEHCFTQREIIRKIYKFLIHHFDLIYTSRVESIMTSDNIASFPGVIQSIIEQGANKKGENIVFVLDHIDLLPASESPGELIKCLSKFHELGQGDMFNIFTFVFVVRRVDFLDISTLSIPTVKFDGYSFEAFKEIVYTQYFDTFWSLLDAVADETFNSDTEMLDSIPEEQALSISDQEKRQFFRQFLNLILETYSSYIGLSIDIVIPILRRIWPVFLDPLIREKKIIKGKNDMLTTFMKNKKLLNKEFAVVTKLDNSEMTLIEYQRSLNKNNIDDENRKGHYDLSVKTKYLVIAAFLASYNEQKYDSQFFSKGDNYNSIMKHRTKRTKVSENGAGRLRRAMSAAIPFKLERLLAILNSIWTENIGTQILDDVELMTEIATLTSLKTLIKLKIGDTIGGQTKWKCNVQWNVVKKFADDVGFDILNHLQD